MRTVATGEARYNPMSYHNGSVWPHDNALIGSGWRATDSGAEAARILQGLFEACMHIDLRRLPELLCGFPRRRRGQGPTFYPVACAPQAWSAVAPLGLLQACLGIGFDPQTSSVLFDRSGPAGSFSRVICCATWRLATARIDVALSGNGAPPGMQPLRRKAISAPSW